ncbi:MAG: aspartyl-tRNA(Asn)/glutamyl-tRNA(Gln) amidotransferase subunit A [Gammaproteobacteria bacterium]
MILQRYVDLHLKLRPDFAFKSAPSGKPEHGQDGVEADDDGVLQDVAQTLRASGAEAMPLDILDPSIAFGLAEIMVKSKAAAVHEPWLRDRLEDDSIAIRAVIEADLFIPGTHYLQG